MQRLHEAFLKPAEKNETNEQAWVNAIQLNDLQSMKKLLEEGFTPKDLSPIGFLLENEFPKEKIQRNSIISSLLSLIEKKEPGFTEKFNKKQREDHEAIELEKKQLYAELKEASKEPTNLKKFQEKIDTEIEKELKQYSEIIRRLKK